MNDSSLMQDTRRYAAMLHKRRAIIITCLGVSLLGAVVYNYTTRPMYQATSQILIAQSALKILPTQEIAGMGQSDYQTEYQLLRSRALVERLVERLKLQTHPELLTGPIMSPSERFQRKVLGKAPASTIGPDGVPLSPAAAAIRSRLTVEPQPGGRLVNLRFQTYDPELAADLANTLAELYVEQSLENRTANTAEAGGWLSERAQDLRQKVEAAERALLDYEARQGLGSSAAQESRIQTLNMAVIDARMVRMAKESALREARSLSPAQLSALPQVASYEGMQNARARLLELQSELAKQGETLGEKHPEIVQLKGEIRSAEQKVLHEAQNALRALESEVRAASGNEAALAANLDEARRTVLSSERKAIDYGSLKRELETNKGLYQALMGRSKETDLESELKSTNVRIVERAEPPGAPFLPRRTYNYQLALMLGLGIGIGLALLFEHVDNTIKTPEDIKEHLGIPFLGMVPDVGGKQGATSLTTTTSLRNPDGPVAEAYRVLRTNLIFSFPESTGRALIVTSANPGEGKTSTTGNVGAALALNGAKVLVIDADLRRPTLHHHFGVQKSPGLADLIVGKSQASEAIRGTRVKGLQILPCGYVPPNPTELLGSPNMRDILAALRTCYDWILIDTPPVLAMADTPVLCPNVDGVILVVAAEASSRPAVLRAIDQLASVGGKVTGVVLNKVDLKRNSYYYSQYYGEYYRSYYAEQAPPKPRAVRDQRAQRS